MIDISQIPQLNQATISQTNGAFIGAAVTQTNCISLLKTWSSQFESYKVKHFLAMIDHWQHVANTPVRNVACWFGSVALEHYYGFTSDIALFLIAAEAVLTIIDAKSQQTTYVKVEEFVQQSYNFTGKVCLGVSIPLLVPGDSFKSYKITLRHVNSHAIVNAAFKISTYSNGLVDGQPVFVYGGIADRAVRMTQAEQAIQGKILNQTTLQSICSILDKEVTPTPGPGKVAYRRSLITSLFFKFFVSCLMSIPSSLGSLVPSFYKRPASSGAEYFKTDPKEFPINKPIPKLAGKLQTSGTAVYTDDEKVPEGTLIAACVTATVSNGTISQIDASAALKAPGVVAFYCAKDIPKTQNTLDFYYETGASNLVFADQVVEYYGQNLGIIVADTKMHAESATKLVKVTYANFKKPILTIQVPRFFSFSGI